MSGFAVSVRAALTGDGQVLAPAHWVVANGRTVALGVAQGEPQLDALLLPGLVNAHAHLDLAGAPPVPDQGRFADWLLAVGAARGESADVRAGAACQAAALARRGVVAIGDVDASRGVATAGRRSAGLDGVSYLELVGVGAESARARLAGALDVVNQLGGAVGLSPHAPYSVNSEVLPEIVRAARRRALPLAMHLAESVDETRYLTHGDGPFVSFLETIGRGRPFAEAPGARPIPWADQLGLLRAGCVVIHGNDLDDDDVALLGERRARVVYCHGTHQHFSRPAHRLLDLAAAGAQLALGTDSGVSNDGVDLLAEMGRLAADRPDVAPQSIIEWATTGGRRALGQDPEAASFAPGSVADGLLLGGLSDDAEELAAEGLASWALEGGAAWHATVHQGRAVFDANPVAALLDTLFGQG